MREALDAFFDVLQRRADQLRSFGDNEAARHDLLVRPLLTDPLGLGWQQGEALSQVNTVVPLEVGRSYYWPGAVPKKRRPDILLVPYQIGAVAGVVEEKRHQPSLTRLEVHTGQLLEYQYLHRCIWGILTDGEKWVLTRNHEVFHRFDGLGDLRRNLKDLQHCIGREAIVDRFRRYKTWDLVHIRPSPTIVVLGTSRSDTSIKTLDAFLSRPSRDGMDLVAHMFFATRGSVYKHLDNVADEYVRQTIGNLFGSGLSNYVTPVVMSAELLIESGVDRDSELVDSYTRSVEKFIAAYPVFQLHCDELLAGLMPSAGWLAEFAHRVDYFGLLHDAPVRFLEEAMAECLAKGDQVLYGALEPILASRRSLL